jgi:uncharacterized membrane protein YkgB
MTQSVTYPARTAPVPAEVSPKSAPATCGLIPDFKNHIAERNVFAIPFRTRMPAVILPAFSFSCDRLLRRDPMNPLGNKSVSVDGTGSTDAHPIAVRLTELLAYPLAKVGLLRDDAEYHLLRAAMVIIFFFFGYQKWFAYEVDRLVPFISNGPLIFWLYPFLGMRGATLFLGVSEWTFGTLIFLGFWNKPLGILGALGSIATFVGTVTIIPFMPDGWDAAAGGFPAMTGNVPFLMKDVVLLAVSVYLLKQDVQRALVTGAVREPAHS